MINRWDRGRAEIDQLIHQGRLTRVAANGISPKATWPRHAPISPRPQPFAISTRLEHSLSLTMLRASPSPPYSSTKDSDHAARAHTPFCLRPQLLSLSHHASPKSADSTGCAASATTPSTPTSSAPRQAGTMSIRLFPPRERLWIAQRDLLR